MQIAVLVLAVLSVGSMGYELFKAKKRQERYLKLVTIIATIGIAILSYFAQQTADKANRELIKLQDERHKELLGGDNLPTVEFFAFTKQETPLNTIPTYYNMDSIEYFVEVGVQLWNESTQHYLKNVECVVTFPNDYLNRKLRTTKMDKFTFEQFQEYYIKEATKEINLGTLPPNVHKQVHRFYLPTVDKEYPVTIDVTWANGFYRGNFVLQKVDPKSTGTTVVSKTNFVLKLKEPVHYILTHSLKDKPKYKLTAGIVYPTEEEQKVILRKGKKAR